MSDHLLRLARLTLRLAGDLSQMDEDGRNLHAELFDFVRDLEAAPAPPRRTITREELNDLVDRCQRLRDRNTTTGAAVEHILRTLRLTVED